MTITNRFTTAALILALTGLAGCGSSSTQDAARDIGKDVGEAAQTAGDAVGNAAEKTGEAIGDAAITTRIKAAIAAEAGLAVLQIGVDTTDGVVKLTGEVKSQANRDTAEAIARKVDGVREVRNDLTVKASG
jgi:hyperosmotically inducible protein